MLLFSKDRSEIVIKTQEYYRLTDIEKAFMKLIKDVDEFTSIKIRDNEVIIIDNRDWQLKEAYEEIERLKVIIKNKN